MEKHGTGRRGAGREWTEGWPVVLGSAIGMMVIATNLATLGVFIAPLEREFGWSRLEITAGHGFTGIAAVLMGPAVGVLADRYGSRRVAIPGVVIFCLALASLSLTASSIWTWWLLWGVLALATLVISPPVWTAAVARSFTRSRGLALALALSGTGLAQAFAPSIATALIAHFGWRGAYIGLSLILAAIALPVIFLCLPRLSSSERAEGRVAARRNNVFTTGEWKAICLSSRFMKLASATFIFTLCAVSFSVNLVPILTSNGATVAGAAAMGAVVGSGSIIGRLSTGYLLDRFDGNRVGAATVLAPICGCLCFVLYPGSLPAALMGTFAIGLALGAELDVIAYLVSRHFGTARFATIFAMVSTTIGIGSSIGPALFSHVYDVAGSYSPALWASIPLYLVGALCLFTLGDYLEDGPIARERRGVREDWSPPSHTEGGVTVGR